MKEFNAQTGGRYCFTEDVLNLQDLALAFSSLFADCSNFIISGCEITGTSISSGYLWINGKVRSFNGATGISAWPQYIYESNNRESIEYANNTTQVGRTIYGCAIAAAVPATLDPVTNSVPQYVSIPSTGGLRMREAFIGRYALLLQSTYLSQTVSDAVTFSSTVSISGNLTLGGQLKLSVGSNLARFYYSGNNAILESKIGTDAAKQIIFGSNNLQIAFGSTTLCTINDSDGYVSSLPITAAKLSIDNIAVDGNNIYENGTVGDTGAIYINKLGYNGGVTAYRNTHIGNGKGDSIVSVYGNTSSVTINGVLTLSGSGQDSLIVKSTLENANTTLRKFVKVIDNSDVVMCKIGYVESNTELKIGNIVGNIKISGTSFVDIGPAIKENGTLLSDKYVTLEYFEEVVEGLGSISGYYTSSQTDNLFAKKANGLSQFITTTNTAAVLRGQLSAVSQSDCDSRYPRLNNYLSDMATTAEQKAQIRTNIGAAAVGSFQSVLYDSGWKAIHEGFAVRQYGQTVCIQGSIYPCREGLTWFQIPNQITAPAYDVGIVFVSGTRHGVAKITAGTKNVVMLFCDESIPTTDKVYISTTYMIPTISSNENT